MRTQAYRKEKVREDIGRRHPSISQGGRTQEPNPKDSLTLGLEPPELWENIFLLFKPRSVWYFYGNLSKSIQPPIVTLPTLLFTIVQDLFPPVC